jgi:hypothetical protein
MRDHDKELIESTQYRRRKWNKHTDYDTTNDRLAVVVILLALIAAFAFIV